METIFNNKTMAQFRQESSGGCVFSLFILVKSLVKKWRATDLEKEIQLF